MRSTSIIFIAVFVVVGLILLSGLAVVFWIMIQKLRKKEEQTTINELAGVSAGTAVRPEPVLVENYAPTVARTGAGPGPDDVQPELRVYR